MLFDGTAHEFSYFFFWSFPLRRFRVKTPLSLTRHIILNAYRYDARLLLDALPPFASTVDHAAAAATSNDDDDDTDERPDSPGGCGWSDLPSDAEDTFFLTPEETADLHRTKRLRHLDDLRTARLRALSPDPDAAAANGHGDPNAASYPWGGSDEEVRFYFKIFTKKKTPVVLNQKTKKDYDKARSLFSFFFFGMCIL